MLIRPVHGQEPQLYVSDPVALHHVINGGTFDEDSMLLSYVLDLPN